MRASVGVRYGTWRRFAVVVSGALVALSVLGTGTSLAAVPDLIVSGYTQDVQLDTVSTTQPGTVSTNDTLQFTTSIYNADTSNVAQLYFTAFVNGVAANVQKVTFADGSAAPCTYAPLACSFGALRSQTGITINVILTTPTSTSGAPTQCTIGSEGYPFDPANQVRTQDFGGPAACITGRWALNGATLSDGGTSHGDYFNWFDGAGLNGDATNFHGRFVYLTDQTTVANNLNVSKGNKQGTQASVNELNIPVVVYDGPTVPAICTGTIALTLGGTFDCSTLSSETSVVEVKNGLSVPLFAVLVKFYSMPGNLKGSSPVALHQYVDSGGNTITETISDQCQLSRGVPTSTSPIPCLAVGNKQVIIWNTHNGKYGF